VAGLLPHKKNRRACLPPFPSIYVIFFLALIYAPFFPHQYIPKMFFPFSPTTYRLLDFGRGASFSSLFLFPRLKFIIEAVRASLSYGLANTRMVDTGTAVPLPLCTARMSRIAGHFPFFSVFQSPTPKNLPRSLFLPPFSWAGVRGIDFPRVKLRCSLCENFISPFFLFPPPPHLSALIALPFFSFFLQWLFRKDCHALPPPYVQT